MESTWRACEELVQTSCRVRSSRFLSFSWVSHLPLLYSSRFSRYSTPIHWLVHGHMTSNNETVSRQMPWAGNIAKTMTSNGKQFTVTREMLTAVARDRWNLSAVFKFYFCFVLLHNKSLNDWSLGEQWILFPSNLNVSLDFVSGIKIHCSLRDQPLSVNYFTLQSVSCQCKDGYAGDGEECEIDPDLDGIPSVGLSCTLPNCYQVRNIICTKEWCLCVINVLRLTVSKVIGAITNYM